MPDSFEWMRSIPKSLKRRHCLRNVALPHMSQAQAVPALRKMAKGLYASPNKTKDPTEEWGLVLKLVRFESWLIAQQVVVKIHLLLSKCAARFH